MGDCSPPPSGLCLGQECKQDPVPRAKMLLDSAEQVQGLQPAKKVCLLGRVWSTPNAADSLLPQSSGAACSLFLNESGHNDLAASFSAAKSEDVKPSPEPSRALDDSEPDDSLLELSGSERGNSPFSYTEEEIQKMLADDCMEAEQPLMSGSHLSQTVNGESGATESGSCSGASGKEDSSGVAEEPLPQEPSPGRSECYPDFWSGSADLDVILLQQDLELSLVATGNSSEASGNNYLLEVEKEVLEAMIDDCLGYGATAGVCVLKDSSEPKGQESLALDFLGRSMASSDQGTSDESSASGSGNKELPKTTKSLFSRKPDTPEDEERGSPGAEQPSGSIKLSDTAVGQTGQEETTSGKKPGKVIPVPQVKEERLEQRTYISEVEVEQKKRFYPDC